MSTHTVQLGVARSARHAQALLNANTTVRLVWDRPVLSRRRASAEEKGVTARPAPLDIVLPDTPARGMLAPQRPLIFVQRRTMFAHPLFHAPAAFAEAWAPHVQSEQDQPQGLRPTVHSAVSADPGTR